MTRQSDVVRGREIIQRWQGLAERRLEYLIDMFETGRWRRFHSEIDFLDNIREAKIAVETWRVLATQEASADNKPVDWSWLDRPKGVPPRRYSISADANQAPPLAPSDQPPVTRPVIRIAAVSPPAAALSPAQAPSIEPPSPPTVRDDWQRAFDPLTMQHRYPILRNAL